MDTNYLIFGAIIIVLIYLILKFAKKFVKLILLLVVIVSLGLFGYLYYFDISNLNDLHSKYCENIDMKKDSLKCVCIVQPIEEDFKTRLSDDKIKNMTKIEFAKELSISLKNKRKVIISKLKENKSLHLLKEFKSDFLKTSE